MLLHLDLGKEKSGNLGVPSAEHYPVSEGKQIILGTNKPSFLVLWTKIGVIAGYHD